MWVARTSGFLYCVAALSLLAAGCVSMRPVPRPLPDSMVLGKTTIAQVAERYGSPARVSAMPRRGATVRYLIYMQARDSSDKPAGPELYGSRGATFFFVDEVLVGYNYESSFASDSTDFDLTLASRIQTGVSTRADVIALLGEPRGAYAYPFVEPTQSAITYLYRATAFTKYGVWHEDKELIITFDASGVVREVRNKL